MDAFLSTNVGWFVLAAALFLGLQGALEIGYRAARRLLSNTPEERSQTASIAGALLALMGFMLAFTFGMAEARYQARRVLVLQEANAIETTYLRADFLPEPERAEARALLREYVDVRLEAVRTREIDAGIARSTEIQMAIWSDVDTAFQKAPVPVAVSLFAQSLNTVIELHEARVTLPSQHRVPPSVLFAVLFLAVMALGMLGVQFGVTRLRSPAASTALIVALSTLILLIIDLDQPYQRFFQVSQEALVDTRRMMHDASAVGARPALAPLPAP